MRRYRKLRVALLLTMALAALALPFGTALAADTADVTITVTPQVLGISVSPDNYDFQAQDVSTTPSTATNYFTITNSSNVVTDQSISVTSASWEGGTYDWTHAEDAVPGNQTVGLKANKGGAWGTGDVIVKNSSPNLIADDQAASTDYDFGLKMWVPTAFSSSETGTEKSNTVRVTVAVAS